MPRPIREIGSRMAFSAACSARGVMLKLVSSTSTLALRTGCEQPANRIGKPTRGDPE